MKKMFLFALALLLLVPAANATVVTLTFQGLKNFEPINNFYNGGTGGFGSGPGGSYGITFTPDSLAIICYGDNPAGSGNCGNSPSKDTIAFFLTGSGDTMNVAAGFTTGFSFFYAAPVYPGSVTVWDGLNGTGTMLASLYLGTTPGGCDGVTTYSCWVATGVGFSGTAKSAVFSGVANYIGFDNITLGATTPGNGTVPEPGSMILLGSGLVALARKLRKA